MAQADEHPVDELAQRRSRANEHSRAYRARQRQQIEQLRELVARQLEAAGAPPPAPPDPPAAPPPREPAPPIAPGTAGGAAAPTVLTTRPLEDLEGPPEAYSWTPPPLEGLAVPAAPVAPVDVDGAKRVASVVAGMFKLALAHASARYDLPTVAGGIARDVAGVELAWEPTAAAAVGFVRDCAERTAIKYGITFPTLPYQDELVTATAVAGSILYLTAAMRGRLPERIGPAEAAPPPADEDRADPRPPERTRTAFDGVEGKPGSRTEVPDWMAPPRRAAS